MLLIALHGWSPVFSLNDFAAQWESLTSRGIALVVPRSSQAANSDGGATWDDRARTERDLRLAHERAATRFGTTRVVIAGFSAGGDAAIMASVMDRPAIGAIGFIAVAAPIHPDITAALTQADPSRRGWIIVGDDDWACDGCVALAEQARVAGLPWHIEVVGWSRSRGSRRTSPRVWSEQPTSSCRPSDDPRQGDPAGPGEGSSLFPLGIFMRWE